LNMAKAIRGMNQKMVLIVITVNVTSP
jgi:hypothetical protein